MPEIVNYTVEQNIRQINHQVVINSRQTNHQVQVNNRVINYTVEIVEGSGGSESLAYEAGEQINSHTPVALVANKLYRFNSLNLAHQFAFVGFTKTSGNSGEDIEVAGDGQSVSLNGWGLTSGVHYLAGPNGTIQTINNTPGSFIKVIGLAQDTNTMLVNKHYNPTIKN